MTNSPLAISMLMHFYSSRQPHESARSMAGEEVIGVFLNDGIIEEYDCGLYRTTPKGEAWVTLIQRVPYPRSAWVDEFGKEITD